MVETGAGNAAVLLFLVSTTVDKCLLFYMFKRVFNSNFLLK